MSLTQALVEEIESEAVGTKEMLKRVPADKFDWKPHEKSMTLKQLATHIVSLSAMAGLMIKTKYLDFAEDTVHRPIVNNTADLIKAFDSGTQQTIEALRSAKDEDLNKEWVMRRGDVVILKALKFKAIRKMAMNHVYHHRAQLGVYLRLLNVPVPGMYGPSSDDKAAAQK